MTFQSIRERALFVVPAAVLIGSCSANGTCGNYENFYGGSNAPFSLLPFSF